MDIVLFLNPTAHRGRALEGRCKLFEAAVGVETALVFIVLHSCFLRALPRSQPPT